MNKLHKNNTSVSIICIKRKGEKSYYDYNGVKVYKFPQLNLPMYRSLLKKTHPDHVLFISSMPKASEIFSWWGVLRLFTIGYKTDFYQTTNFFNLKKNFFLNVFLKSFKIVFSASNAIQSDLKKFAGINSQIIYPGTEFPPNVTLKKQSISNLGFSGHIVAAKGIDLFVKLSEQFPKLHFFLLAGKTKTQKNTQLEDYIERKSKELKNLTLFGFMDHPLDVMSKCDVLILPYRHGGAILGTAQSAIEAMSMGIPVIGTDNSALSSILKDNYNGLVAKPHLADIKKKINLLIKNRNLYNRLSKNARITVEKKFDISKISICLLNHLK
ncbi:MAG: glycosyltransferase family 4 protein [Patescibacteria group bacterium]|nr:glycosyltransferase family 4 protein [Patescibacteria group bacterium]